MDLSDATIKSPKFDGLDNQEASTKTSDDQSLHTFESFKMDEFDEARRNTHKRLIIIALSSILLILLILGAIFGILILLHEKNNINPSSMKAENDSIRAICNSTLYQDSCYSSIYSLKMSSGPNPGPEPDTPDEIFALSLQVTLNELVRLKSSISFTRSNNKNESISTRNALEVCDCIFQDAIDHVNMSISDFHHEFSSDSVSDLRTWISTAITDYETCLDALTVFNDTSIWIQEEIKASMENSTMFTSNSLAIISNNILTIMSHFQVPIHRKSLQLHGDANLVKWTARMLLESDLITRPDLTVAKDGSGDYPTIAEALRSVPKRSKRRFFIYVKEGEYKENVTVFHNTITGTIDFIFGNAAAVFQNCTIQPREPAEPGQYNTVTAQSKSDPNQNTGFSIQRCGISPFGELTARSFLGRPWNNYSTVVVMESDIEGIIDPAGWVQWAPETEAPDTILYAEYKNVGPGSILDGRVMWPGYRPDITEQEAWKFYVDQFIQGNKWITEANLEYDSHV